MQVPGSNQSSALLSLPSLLFPLPSSTSQADLNMSTSILRSCFTVCTTHKGHPCKPLIRGEYWVNEESVWFSTLSFSEPNETQFAFLMNSLYKLYLTFPNLSQGLWEEKMRHIRNTFSIVLGTRVHLVVLYSVFLSFTLCRYPLENFSFNLVRKVNICRKHMGVFFSEKGYMSRPRYRCGHY